MLHDTHNFSFQKLDDYDVEASRVMEVSKQITKYKQSQVTKDSSGSELAKDEEFMEIFKSYEGNNIKTVSHATDDALVSLCKLLGRVLNGKWGFNSTSIGRATFFGEDYCLYI